MSGVSGLIGPSGLSGLLGNSGISGLSGISGIKGTGGALGYYGSFYSDQDQQHLSIDNGIAMTLNNTSESNGVTIQNSSQITFANPGTYDIQFSAQLHHFLLNFFSGRGNRFP